MNSKDDVDVVVTQNQHPLQQMKKTTVEVSHPIYQRINSYISKKYPTSKYLGDTIAKEIDYIFSLGVEKAEKELECLLLFEEKKPRMDVLENLGKIANELQSNPDYPKIKSMTITKTINKILGSKVNRTKTKYHNCIHQYITKPGELGIVDVSNFVNRIPNRFLNTTTSTSSFGENYE